MWPVEKQAIIVFLKKMRLFKQQAYSGLIIFFLVFTSFSMEYCEDVHSLKALYYANCYEPIKDSPSKIDVTKMFSKDVTTITDDESYIEAYELYWRINESIEDKIGRNIFMSFVFSHFSNCLQFPICPQHPSCKLRKYCSLFYPYKKKTL